MLQGVATLLEDATKADQDWAKLAGIPGMLEGWPELLTRLETGTQDFQAHARLAVLCHASAQSLSSVYELCAAMSGIASLSRPPAYKTALFLSSQLRT